MKIIPVPNRGVSVIIATVSLCLISKAGAALTFHFAENGADVMATVSGSLSFSGATVDGDNNAGLGSTWLAGSTAFFVYLPSGDLLRYVFSPVILFLPLSLGHPHKLDHTHWMARTQRTSGSLCDCSASTLGSVTPNGSFTWSGQTLDRIGMGYLKSIDSAAVLRVDGSSDEVLSTTKPVPEPSAVMHFGFGFLGLLLRRKVH